MIEDAVVEQKLSRECVDHRDPILRQVMPTFDFDDPPIDPKVLAAHLDDMRRAKKGYGLSACQLGLPYRAFSIQWEMPFVLFNPSVVDTSSDVVEMEEGCLSLPGIVMKVSRPSKIKVRFKHWHGETKTLKFEGLTARVIQHELDHLNGVLFTDYFVTQSYAKRLRLTMALKKAKKKGFPYSLESLKSNVSPDQ